MAKRLIDAEDVKELLKGLDSLPWEEEVDVLVDRLEAVELPVRGEWIRQDDTYTKFMCSNCGTFNHPLTYDFCPNCGADMRKKVTE